MFGINHHMLLPRLQKLPEPEFTKDVVMPFLEQVLKGHIEYTHSATEAGRDIVVFTSDPLGKEKIYCIQVKVTDISYGAAAFGGIFHTLMTAKREGVTLTDGRSRKPHEVWFINSATFPENERRQVRSSLEELDLNNIRVIAGEEFAHLLEQRTPDLARSLLSSDARTISDLSKQLFSHPESRAFGLLPDKQVNDFYVTATLSPSHEDAYLAIDGRLEINKTALEVTISPRLALEEWKARYKVTAPKLTNAQTKEFLTEIALSKAGVAEGVKKFGIGCSVAWDDVDLSTACSLKSVRLEIGFELEQSLAELTRISSEALLRCPEELSDDPIEVLLAIDSLERLQHFVRFCDLELNQSLEIKVLEQPEPRKRIKLPKPENLVHLGRRVLIDGPPGCGKTTMMKVAAVRLIERSHKVRFVSCSQIPKSEKSRNLEDLLPRFCRLRPSAKIGPGDILLFDALDEGPAWLSTVIQRGTEVGSKVIVSTRTAFLRNAPRDFLSLRVAPFTADERDVFFDRWLTGHGLASKKRTLI